MAKLFRALIRKHAWVWDDPPPKWLDKGDIPADPLGSLIPDKHRLSLFEVNDDRGRVQRVAAALALKRENARGIDTVEFIVIDEKVIDDVGIEIDKTVLGDTCDPDVNAWHRDLVDVSADKLVALAKRIVPSVVRDVAPQKELQDAFIESCRWALPKKVDSKLRQVDVIAPFELFWA